MSVIPKIGCSHAGRGIGSNHDLLVTYHKTLEGYFRTEAQKVPQPQVAIRPHARAKYDVVDQVLAAAQRNRIEKMGLIGNEQFE